jgi:hypothetical protein
MSNKEFTNRLENLSKLKKERIALKIEMNKLMDEMVEDRNTLNNISRNNVLKIQIQKLDILNDKIKNIESYIIY